MAARQENSEYRKKYGKEDNVSEAFLSFPF
jgi:hypothetical protein